MNHASPGEKYRGPLLETFSLNRLNNAVPDLGSEINATTKTAIQALMRRSARTRRV